MKRLVFLLIPLILAACAGNDKTEPADEICGLASPVNFSGDSLMLILGDYFTDPSVIVQVVFPEGIRAKKTDSTGIYQLVKTPDLKPLSVITVETRKATYGLLVKNFNRQSVYIVVPDKDYKDVKVRGNLNFWNARLSKMHKTDTGWV